MNSEYNAFYYTLIFKHKIYIKVNNLCVPKKYLKYKINTISQNRKRKEQNTNPYYS